MAFRFPTHRDPAPVAPSASAPTSRRALLGALAAAPVAIPVLASPGGARPLSPGSVSGGPVALHRTRAGRDLSRARYRNAEEFFAGIEAGIVPPGAGMLYHTGIVIQLGLSAHLLDVGFDDAWCARHIGLHLDRSLALANASGLGLDAPPIAALAGFLSPYGQWRHADLGAAPDCPFTPTAMRTLTRALLDHVRAVTGHRLPAHGRRHRGRA
jgi:hypothetical protein